MSVDREFVEYYASLDEHEVFVAEHEKLLEDTSEPFTLINSLKACAKAKDLHTGRKLHYDIARRLLECNLFIGSSLINMYAKCGALAIAQAVFDKLLVRNNVVWNALIAGYAQNKLAEEALYGFERMQCEGLSPNAVTFVCTLNACGSMGAVDKGQVLHAWIFNDDFLRRDTIVGNALIDMYGKSGLVMKAQEVFDDLPDHNTLAWTALITAYAQHGHGEEALHCLARMQLEGLSPNAVTFLCILQGCGIVGASHKGVEIHVQIDSLRLHGKDVVLGTALVDMYAKCGLLVKAQEVFDALPAQNVVSWTAMIAGYAQHGLGEKALECFEQMHVKGVSPNAVTYVCILKVCGNLRAMEKGQEIHNQIVRDGLLEKEIVVANAIIEMYAEVGMLAKAQEVLDKLPARNEVSWNLLIVGYAQYQLAEEALTCYDRMQQEGLSPDAITFACILKTCGSLHAGDKGQEIHTQIAKDGLLETNVIVANALVDMYGKCGMLGKAQEVHDKLPVRSVVSWNALIVGYVQYGYGEKALHCFECMQQEGHCPDGITLTCVLKACGIVQALDKGQEVHTQFVRDGLLEDDVAIANALVDMYAKCGALVQAQDLFDVLSVQNVVSWTALIAGYTQCGYNKEAVSCFEKMQEDGFFPDAFMFVCILKSCSSTRATEKGKGLHAKFVSNGSLGVDIILGNELLKMNRKCGALVTVAHLFEETPARDVVSWNKLVTTTHSKHGHSEAALNFLKQMGDEGQIPDVVTFIGSLKACFAIGATERGYMEHAQNEEAMSGLELLNQLMGEEFPPDKVTFGSILNACADCSMLLDGKKLHSHIVKSDLGLDALIRSTLIDIYGKCGHLHEAIMVFESRLKQDDVVTWNIMCVLYPQHEQWEDVSKLFAQK